MISLQRVALSFDHLFLFERVSLIAPFKSLVSNLSFMVFKIVPEPHTNAVQAVKCLGSAFDRPTCFVSIFVACDRIKTVVSQFNMNNFVAVHLLSADEIQHLFFL